MQKQKTARKAARPCQTPAAQNQSAKSTLADVRRALPAAPQVIELHLRLPAEVSPLLSACAAASETCPHDYILQALYAAIRGEADNFQATADSILEQVEGGQI